MYLLWHLLTIGSTGQHGMASSVGGDGVESRVRTGERRFTVTSTSPHLRTLWVGSWTVLGEQDEGLNISEVVNASISPIIGYMRAPCLSDVV